MLTLTELKRFLEIDLSNTSKDELLSECIAAAIKELDSLTNRSLEDGLKQDIFDGSGLQIAFLNQYPIAEITKLQQLTNEGFTDIIKDPDAIAETVLILNTGMICLLKNFTFPDGENNILAEYRAGYMTADLWKKNTKYSIGDRVNYQNILYSCLHLHDSGDTFEPDYWQKLNSECVPDDLKKAVKYLAARNFFDSPAGKNLIMKRSESTGGIFSSGVVYKDLEIEHIINRYKKPNI